MKEDERGCIELQGPSHQLPWVDAGLAQAAVEQLLDLKQPPLAIEEGGTKDLVGSPSQVAKQPGADLQGRLKGLIARLDAVDPTQCLAACLDSREFARANTRNALDVLRFGRQDGCKAAETVQKGGGDLVAGGPAASGANEDGENLAVGEALATPLKESLTGQFGLVGISADLVGNNWHSAASE